MMGIMLLLKTIQSGKLHENHEQEAYLLMELATSSDFSNSLFLTITLTSRASPGEHTSNLASNVRWFPEMEWMTLNYDLKVTLHRK